MNTFENPKITNNIDGSMPGDDKNQLIPEAVLDRLSGVPLRYVKMPVLSVRTQRVITQLCSEDLPGFLSIRPEDVMALRGIGVGTLNEILAIQHFLRDKLCEGPNVLEKLIFNRDLLGLKQSEEVMETDISGFRTLRLRISNGMNHLLDRLGINSISQFLDLDLMTVKKVDHNGYTYWHKIERLQEEIYREGIPILPQAATDKIQFINQKQLSPKELMAMPVSRETLQYLPFFSGRQWASVSPDLFHITYCSDVPIAFFPWGKLDLSAKDRSLTSIGDLLLTPASNITHKLSLSLVKKQLRNFLSCAASSQQLDMSSFAGMVSNMLAINAPKKGMVQQRNIEIALIRMGFGKSRNTLEEIGINYGLTRSRIQQIDNWLKIKQRINYPLMRTFWDVVNQYIENENGSMEISKLAEKLRQHYNWLQPPTVIQFRQLLKLQWKYRVVKEGLIIRKGHPCYCCTDFIGRLRKQVNSSHVGLHLVDVCRLLSEECRLSCPKLVQPPSRIPLDLVLDAVDLCKDVYLVNDDLLPGKVWRLRHGKILYQVIEEMLEEIGKPVNYHELAARIREINQNFQTIKDKQVHVCLANNKDFQFFAPEMYALLRWGLASFRSTVDIIRKLMQETGKAMKINEMVDYLVMVNTDVSKQRHYHRVLSAMSTNSRLFIRVGYGCYMLREQYRANE